MHERTNEVWLDSTRSKRRILLPRLLSPNRRRREESPTPAPRSLLIPRPPLRRSRAIHRLLDRNSLIQRDPAFRLLIAEGRATRLKQGVRVGVFTFWPG